MASRSKKPLMEACCALLKNVVYQATLTQGAHKTENYVGLTAQHLRKSGMAAQICSDMNNEQC